jgi:Zn-dependent protease with chaperone function
MGQRLAAFVVASAVGVSLPASATGQSDDERTFQKAMALFEGHSDETIDAFLMRLRPAPLDEKSRATVVASLPRHGEVRQSRQDIKKLAVAQRVLDSSVDAGAMTVKVIDANSAYVGLYYRTVVLVSTKALALLRPDELAAVVAHEVGHDAHWDAYWTAIQRRDRQRLRALELKADGIAVLTLKRLEITPERLVSALQKLIAYNEYRDRTVSERYVPLSERVAFIRAVARLRWADAVISSPSEPNLKQCGRRVMDLAPVPQR